MRLFLPTLACLVLLSLPGAAATDPLDELHGSVFTSCHDVTARLPHGRLTIHSGVVAFLPGLERRTAGLVIGDVDVVFDALPSGTGSVNLFAEMDSAQAGTAAAPLTFKVEAAYLNSSTTSGAQVEPTGHATAIRLWNQLEDEEQERFEEVYLQAYGDSWVRDAPQTDEGFRLRDPVDGEVYAAFWAPDPVVMPDVPDAGVTNPDGSVSSPIPAPRELTRFDYRVLADDETVTLEDYARGITLVQYPWASEEGEADAAVQLHSAHYLYFFTPGTEKEPDRIRTTVISQITNSEARKRLSLISNPYFGDPIQAGFLPDSEHRVSRGGDGLSEWTISLTGSKEGSQESYWLSDELSYKPTKGVTLVVPFGETQVSETFQGPGYAGVYRFDTSPLQAATSTTDVEITVRTIGSDWSVHSSGAAPIVIEPHAPDYELQDTGSPQIEARAEWPASTRNQMLVLTKFPSRAVPTTWGTLNVTAPAEMLDDTAQLAGVQSLEAMVDYFLRAWGDPRTGAQIADGIPAEPYTLNVFFIPGESGVQAFEDAGMVFILGGQQSYGGAGGGQLPLIAHEVAHVWWGHGVAAPRWFTEGMANYAAAKFVEEYYGAGGPAAGQGDPLSYRRYLVNFGLGSSIPVRLERRDQLDDSAAIYHESAGFLLTADNRIAGGLDPVLAQLYASHVNAPELSHAQLRAQLATLAPEIAPVWDGMVEQGRVESVATDDPTFREMVHSPVSRNYGNLLRWLNPVYRKRAAGDLHGAYYCAQRVLDYRRDLGDVVTCAELAFQLGRTEEAWRWLGVSSDASTERNSVRYEWLRARMLRAGGGAQGEYNALGLVLEKGDSVGMSAEAEAARTRRAELEAQGITASLEVIELACGDAGILFALLDREYLALHAYRAGVERDPFLLVGFVRGSFEIASISAVSGKHALRVGYPDEPTTDMPLLQSFGSRTNIDRELSEDYSAPLLEGLEALRDMPGVTWLDGPLLHTDRRIYIPTSQLLPEVRAGLYDGTVQIVVLTDNMEGEVSLVPKIPFY